MGEKEGAKVGAVVGKSEGIYVGEKDGPDIGAFVGLVGTGVGIQVGDSVGEYKAVVVGTGVGGNKVINVCISVEKRDGEDVGNCGIK